MKALILILFPIFSFIYYAFSFSTHDFYPLFLTISTFLFGIFAGFFIARQGNRYSQIREKIAAFDGDISSIYRQFGHFGKEAQEKYKQIIKKHYTVILKNKAWDYHLIRKSTTINSIHQLTDEVARGKDFKSLEASVLRQLFGSLRNLQVARKGMVVLHQERIPKFQWFLIYFLALILIVALSTIPSQYFLLGAILKGAFASAVILVVFLLHEFDKLKFFESAIGEKSAQDILDIFQGKR